MSVDGNPPAGAAATLSECQAACVTDNDCTAIAWQDPPTTCLTFTTTAATEVEQGTTLYYLNRVCLG